MAYPGPVIRTHALAKVYRVPVKQPGLWSSVRSLWNRKYRDVRAVDGIDLVVGEGERIGFLGPNGAGKTTTLKMLTGLLHPSAGTCEHLQRLRVQLHRPRKPLARRHGPGGRAGCS